MRIDSDEQTTLEQLGIGEGSKIHLQDQLAVNQKSNLGSQLLSESLSLPSGSSSLVKSSFVLSSSQI